MQDQIELVYRNGIPGYIRANGDFLPMVAGGDETPEEKAAREAAEEAARKAAEENDDEDDDDEDDKTKDITARLDASLEKSARMKKRRDEEKARADAAEARLKEIEDKDKSDATKAQEALETAQEENEDLKVQVRTLTLENKMLLHGDLAALTPARRNMIISGLINKIEVDDDGEDNFDSLIEDLKKEDPDMFKGASNGDGEDDDDEEDDKKPPKSSGTTPPAKKKKDKHTIDREALRKRFPALGR